MEGSLTFRPKLRELGTLALVGLQMVYLTATLPPADEAAFFSMVNAQREDVVIIRARITRRNVAYSVRSVTATTAKEAVAAVVEEARATIDQKLEEHPWPAKIIVYCQRVEAIEDLAGKLGCDAYYREIDIRDGKAERLKFWMSGTKREQYIRGDACRRVILDSVMDGRNDREGCEDGEELCDVCQRQASEERREEEEDGGGDLEEDREEYDMRQRELQVENARYQATTLAAEEHEQFQDY
ncbi:hypothetical protein F66182_6017 [Fusarium sp. NRRL 66182]|nr:hypothetical protein F66182_6017 [Fusarium sp. NRRL 66182]